MMLGEHFPKEIKSEYIERSLKVGNVLRLFVKDTNPPKTKRFIIMGITQDMLCIAVVYINSEINENVNWAIELIEQQLPLEADGREYLDWDSHVDCSKLIIKDYNEIHQAIRNRPEAIIGTLSEADLRLVKEKIISSESIKGKQKKKFGFYD